MSLLRPRRTPPPREAERIFGFTDAVFAIAITLLALDVRVPEWPEGELATALADTWPQVLAYGVSFLLIGQVWASHHAMFQWIGRSDHILLVLEVGLLACVALQPVPTRLVAETLTEHGSADSAIAVATYSGLLFLGGLFYNAVWHRARTAGLLIDGLDPALVRRESLRNASGPLVYLMAMGVAFVSVPIALVLDVLLIAGYLLPGPDLRAAD